MIMRAFDYVDNMGPAEFTCWAALFLILILGFDYWRSFGGQ